MTESRERNAAQDVPISGINSTRLIQLRPKTHPGHFRCLRLFAWPFCPSILPPDAIATPLVWYRQRMKSNGAILALSDYMCFPNYEYWRNAPQITGDLPQDNITGRELHCTLSPIPSRSAKSAFGVHVPTRQTPLQPALGPSLCYPKALQARNRLNERWSTDRSCLCFFRRSLCVILRRSRGLPDRRKPSTSCVRIVSSRRTSSTRSKSFALLFDPFAEAISHVSIRPVPTPSPSAAFCSSSWPWR